jgi:hypothetical protein
MVSQSTNIFNQRYASIEKYERCPKKRSDQSRVDLDIFSCEL